MRLCPEAALITETGRRPRWLTGRVWVASPGFQQKAFVQNLDDTIRAQIVVGLRTFWTSYVDLHGRLKEKNPRPSAASPIRSALGVPALCLALAGRMLRGHVICSPGPPREDARVLSPTWNLVSMATALSFLARGWDSLWKRTLEPHLSVGWSPAVLWGLTRAPSGLAKPGWTSGAAQMSPVHVTDPRTPAVNGRRHVKPPRSEMVRVQGHNENHSAFERVK